jgi:hypothetical protein
MPTLPNMNLVTPTLNNDNGAWDDKINVALGLIDAHDHTSGKGLRITPSAMNINANLGFGGFAITAAGQVAFTAVAALAAGSKTLFVSSVDNELYWRTNGGTNVKLTDGNSINTSLVGGIVGDYSSVGAEVSYSDAGKIYTFKNEDATGKWSRVGAGTIRIFEHNTTETVYVELAAPAALAAPYTVTFATALPATTSFITISAAGQIVYHASLAEIAFNCSHWGVTLATALVGGSALGASGLYEAVIPLPVGSVIKSWALVLDKTTSGVNTVTAQMFKTGSGGTTALGAAQTNTAANPGSITLTETGVTFSLATTEEFFLRQTASAYTGGGAEIPTRIQITYERLP